MCGPTSDHAHLALAPSAEVGLDLMAAHDGLAATNAARLAARGICCINLMSGPGSGKTTLLERTLALLGAGHGIAVLEGDMTTELDAERLRVCGAPVVAITTGRACHLDAELVAHGLDQLERAGDLAGRRLLVIENVGNLVCPAEFALGEHRRATLVALTEGEDKPLKYPYMFQQTDCVVVTKLDLLPYLRVSLERLVANIRQVNPHAPILALSAETGAGMDEWLGWLDEQLLVPGSYRA